MSVRSKLPALFLILATSALLKAEPDAGTAVNTAIVPVPRDEWMQSHKSYVSRAEKGNVEVLFLGDSITEGWRGRGADPWNEHFAKLNAVNFGIGGDRTENVLWRLQNGEFQNITPRAVVLLIGTNNLKLNTVPQIIEGIKAIVQEIRKRSPDTKILLLGILPREEKPGGKYRDMIAEINAALAPMADDKYVFFLDIGRLFLLPDGSISPKIMADFLHPTAEGYTIFARAIAAKLTAILQP